MIESLKDKIYIILAIILRVIYGLKSTPLNCQHDVMGENGHFEYARYIFRYLKLPMTNDGEFYHPPLNAILQGLWMRFAMIFNPPKKNVAVKLNEYLSGLNIIGLDKNESLNKYILGLYKSCNILSTLYSILTIIIIYKIIKLFDLKKTVQDLIFILVAFLPGFIIFAGQYNNDGITILLFFLSIYISIRWCKDDKLSYMILLALSIGFSMLCRVSNAILAFIIGPMFILKLFNVIKKGETIRVKKYIKQYLIFLLIVIPISFSYILRNYLLFGQSVTFVPAISKGTILEIVNHGAIDRFFSLPLDRLFDGPFGIYHDVREYNIWVDLIKSAAYQEFIYTDSYANIPCYILIIWNFIFSILSVVSLIIILIKKLRKKYIINRDISNLSILLVIVSTISYILFTAKFSYSCTSNYRYISYATFAYAILSTIFVENLNNKIFSKIYKVFVYVLLITSTIFVLLV